MSDLIELVRGASGVAKLWGHPVEAIIIGDAADQLEAQQAEIARLREALVILKAHCNEHIRSINQGEGGNTAGFPQINKLLKQCDVAFKALEQKP